MDTTSKSATAKKEKWVLPPCLSIARNHPFFLPLSLSPSLLLSTILSPHFSFFRLILAYRVAGTIIAAAGGKAWDATDDRGLLTPAGEGFVFGLLASVPKGTYEFKVSVEEENDTIKTHVVTSATHVLTRLLADRWR